jgi:tetratricopeptide (TPR) repeat protein
LNVGERTLGPSHPEVAKVLNNLAALYSLQHRYSEAEPLYQRALAIREETLGPDHPDLASTLNGYAQLLRKIKRKSEASAMQARAKEILAKADRSARQTVHVGDLDPKRSWKK